MIVMCIWIPGSPSHGMDAFPWQTLLTERIPKRIGRAMTGSEFVRYVSGMDTQQREEIIEEQLLAGNIPQFLRRLDPIPIEDGNGENPLTIIIFVMPDYLAIGANQDFIRIPMNFETARTIANRFGFLLPTKKIVDILYERSDYRFRPEPMYPGPEMRSTRYYQRHNQMIRRQRLVLNAPLGSLLAGHKKDLVITRRLESHPNRVAIYGWHRLTGIPIQPLSTVHGIRYADYSHGVRLVSQTVLVDGRRMSLYDVLDCPGLARVLCGEGPIPSLSRIMGSRSPREARFTPYSPQG